MFYTLYFKSRGRSRGHSATVYVLSTCLFNSCLYISLYVLIASLVAQRVKRLPAKQETWVRCLGQEDPLEKEMATHSSTFAWKIPWMEELVGYSPWVCKESDTTEQLHFHFHMYWQIFDHLFNHGCESWIIKKAECQGIDAFELWCWRRLLRVPGTARSSNQSILKEISLEYLLEGLMLKLKLLYFGHLTWRATSLEKALILGNIEGRRRGWQRMR